MGVAGVTLFVLSRRARRRQPPAPADEGDAPSSAAPTGVSADPTG